MNTEQYFEEPLPHWASGKTTYLCLDCQLPTKDGRRIGNAVIYRLELMDTHRAQRLNILQESNKVFYHIVTDAGNTMVLTNKEVEELFYAPSEEEPCYVMKEYYVKETLARREVFV